MGYTPHPEARTALARSFELIRDELNTPESAGRALIQFALTEAAAKGTFNADGTAIELPLTLSMTVPKTTEVSRNATVRSQSCSSVCIRSGGHEIVCVQVCHWT